MIKRDKIDIKRVYDDLHRGVSAWSTLHKEMRTDYEYAHGKQWDSHDVHILKNRGVKALTINKIRPNIKLLTGIERQSRSDYAAFPEGEEDSTVAEITTRLLKNINKRADGDRKLSSLFKNGCIEGMRFLEPYMDYSKDIINGELKFREVAGSRIFLDPDFKEYDLSDCKFIIKLTEGLTKDDVLNLFPEKGERLLNKVTNGRISRQEGGVKTILERDDYPDLQSREGFRDGEEIDNTFDLVEYYYKKQVDVYYIADFKLGTVQRAENKEKAEVFAAQFPDAKIVVKKQPEIRLKQVVGDVEFSDDVAWSYPKWEYYPIIPFFYELSDADIKEWELKIQGFVRGMRDLQEEFNKRRTQELKHVNSSISTGWFMTEGSMTAQEEHHLKEHGSSGGFLGKVKQGYDDPRMIAPPQLGLNHTRLAEEHSQDMKEATGINPDLLANDSESQSGRAILLKQRQGLVMVQEPLDNYGFTKRILGRFLLSQLGEVFTVETAIKVLGQAFVNQNFQVPVRAIFERASQKNPQDLTDVELDVLGQFQNAKSEADFANPDGSPITIVDPDEVGQVINGVLNDTGIGRYDVSIGEGVYTETVRMSEFLSAQELAQTVPIPPQILVELSNLPEAQKTKAIKALEAQLTGGLNA